MPISLFLSSFHRNLVALKSSGCLLISRFPACNCTPSQVRSIDSSLCSPVFHHGAPMETTSSHRPWDPLACAPPVPSHVLPEVLYCWVAHCGCCWGSLIEFLLNILLLSSGHKRVWLCIGFDWSSILLTVRQLWSLRALFLDSINRFRSQSCSVPLCQP